jgi:predicted RecB family nuclease
LEAGRIRGRVDAIYTEGSAWEIVDFKSGRHRDDPARRVQLEAYAVAAADVRFGKEPPGELRVTFAYFGDGLEEVSESVDAAWLDEARRHLDELAAGAAGEVFEETPSPACHTCDFLRFCDVGKAHVEA